MDVTLGTRERKKRETRHRLGDVAAALFAQYGYDSVSVSDVAKAAGVADQTVYNYFPTKPDLVLDRADEFLERSRRVVAERERGHTPADAIRPLVHEDIERIMTEDLSLARGEFPALCLESGMLRRYALEFRNDQAAAIGHAITQTNPDMHPLVARSHAGALVAIIQSITDSIGAAVLADVDRTVVANGLRRDADLALDAAALAFLATHA